MASGHSAVTQSCSEEGNGCSVSSEFSFVSQDHNCPVCGVPRVYFDSGTHSVEPGYVHDSSEDSQPQTRAMCGSADTNGFSEEELLNITFEACDSTGEGKVRASSVIQFLQAVTLHTSAQEKLSRLSLMLDPLNQDASVNRDTFHTTMREWIEQCCEDGAADDKNKTQRSFLRQSSLSGNKLLSSNEDTFTNSNECLCESADVSALVAELKHTRHRLGDQNSTLMRSLSQCEDTILQLRLQISELHTKLASSQLFVVRARSLSEELDESRSALRESQERAARAQASYSTLIKENERLRARIKITEEKNEKLSHEKILAEEELNKLNRENSELREDLEDCQMLLAVKDRDLTKKSILLEKLRDTHFEGHRIMEGLQSELVRLQEHSQQTLSRLNNYHVISCDKQRIGVTNHHSLHYEIQEAQQNGPVEMSDGSPKQIVPQGGENQTNLKIKPLELSHILYTQLSQNDKVWNCERLEYLKELEHNGNSRHELLTLLKELELLDSPLAMQAQNKAKLKRQEANIGATIAWWRGHSKEGKNNPTTPEHQEAVLDILKQNLLVRNQGTSTSEDDRTPFRDVAVLTDWSVENLVDENVLKTWRNVDDMVAQTLSVAQGFMGIEKKMERMDEVSMRLQEVMKRVEDTERLISALEGTVSANTQSLCKSEIVAAGFLVEYNSPGITSFATSEPETKESTQEHAVSFKQGATLLDTRDTEDHNRKVSQTVDSSLINQVPGSPSELLLWAETSACTDPVSHENNPQKSCKEVSPPEQSASEESSPPHKQENGAGFDQPTSQQSFISEPELVSDKETSRKQNTEEPVCPRTELQNNTFKKEIFGKCHVYSRAEALKLLNQGLVSNSPEYWDNQELSSSGEARVEDTQSSLIERKEPDFIGEKSELNKKSRLRTGDSETQERQENSAQDFLISAQDPSVSTEDREKLSVCSFTGSQRGNTLLKRADSFLTESVTPFIFPHTRPRPPLVPAMPTLPEEEEDSPEESTSGSPSTYAPKQTKMVNVSMNPPVIVLPRQVNKQESSSLEKARPHSPRPRLSRSSQSPFPITTVDDAGRVIDLVKDRLPDLRLSEEDRLKNLELLEEAKKVSDRFLQRRGRRSTCSLSESPTALSPNLTPCSSPRPSRSSSLSTGPEITLSPPASPSISQSSQEQGDISKTELESFSRLVDWMPIDKRKVSGTLTQRYATPIPPKDGAVVQNNRAEPQGPSETSANSENVVQKKEETPNRGFNQAPATGVAKPVPRPLTQQAPCTAEIKTIGAFPPLMRAVSFDTVGSMNMRNAAPKSEDDLSSFSERSMESLFKSSGYKDFPVPSGKLSKMREEHKLLRNQSISSSKLPDLSETAEQDRGPPSPLTSSPCEEEAKEKPDAMPNISDVMLRKLKLHRGLPGSAPPLSEKEIENAFVQLSLAFRNDNYTLESRQKQAERDRNMTEENLEKELEEFKSSLKRTVSLWQNMEQREFYQNLLETIGVLHRLSNRLSSRAEMVGAVRQEKRMNKATEVMMQYVENLKRTYEKDHAELMEFKKLANQNSNRCYGGSVDTGDEGVPRSARSMSMQMGKALPRRRVSVAVVPKFNLLNIPGQTPAAGLPVLCEANTKNGSSSDQTQQDVPDKSNGNPPTEQEGEAPPAKAVCSPEKITEEIRAKIEEEAFNKGYKEGLKRSKELRELKEEEDKAEEKQKECEEELMVNLDDTRKTHRFDEALELLDRIFPKFFRRNRMLWIVLALFFILFIIANVVNIYSSRYGDSGDTSTERSAIPGKKKFFGLNVGSKTPAPE